MAHGKCCRRLGGRGGGPRWALVAAEGGPPREGLSAETEVGALRPRSPARGGGGGAEVPGQTGWRAPERWCFLGRRWGGWEGLR